MDAIELMKVQARGMALMVKQIKTDFCVTWILSIITISLKQMSWTYNKCIECELNKISQFENLVYLHGMLLKTCPLNIFSFIIFTDSFQERRQVNTFIPSYTNS